MFELNKMVKETVFDTCHRPFFFWVHSLDTPYALILLFGCMSRPIFKVFGVDSVNEKGGDL